MSSESPPQTQCPNCRARKVILEKIATNLSNNFVDTLNKSLKTCLNCENFEEHSENCRLVNARPPARVICEGCESWTEIIPF